MKAIRRSLKGEKEPKPQHISITPKSAIAIVPPKKVIKALYDYEPDKSSQFELGFHKGDFFHVISREDDPDWYEACNPLIPTARGLVPVGFFEVIGKTERQSAGSAGSGASNQLPAHDSGFSERNTAQNPIHNRTESTNTTKTGAHARMSSVSKGTGAMVYGIVQYDFNAERPDELEAKAGEAIIVIAQSNPEWFVAKPIGRLGGPGLIPVSFIEIRDMTTGQAVIDPHEAVQRAGVPKVEEWKKMAADYKNSSITLGKFEAGGGGGVQSMSTDMERMSLSNGGQQYANQNGNGYGQSYHQRNASKTNQSAQNPYHRPNSSQFLAPVSASIPRYCFDNDKYWYIIEAVMEDGRHWELSRYYHDFYDFQIALLAQFPEEAGNSESGKPRTLPFMPGPVTHVTDAISNGRRHNLDEYIKKLLSMSAHISRCDIVRLLFAPREGDFEIDPNAIGEDYRLSGASQQSSSQHDPSRTASRQSSRGQLPSNVVSGGNVYPAGAPVQSRTPQQHQRAAQSVSSPAGGAYLTGANGSDLNLRQQPSTITQASTTSSQGQGGANPGGALKIKVFFQEDIIAIRVPSDIPFSQLKEKLKDRLKVNDEILVQYRDEMTGTFGDVTGDQDLDIAIQRNPKLTLYVSYA